MPKFDEFEAAPVTVSGAQVLKTDINNRHLVLDRGIVYKQAYRQDLHIHLISPEYVEMREEPLVIFVQGSAWMAQDLDNHLMDLYPIAMAGYKVAIVEYRPSTLRPFPAQAEDVKDAVRFMYEHQKEFGVDGSRMFLMGDSSGAHSALMALMRWEPDMPSVRGLVDYYGPTDIVAMNAAPSAMDHAAPNSPEGLLIGGYPVLESPERTSPTVVMNYITEEKPLPPIAIFHGTRDRLVPYSQSELLYRKLVECHKTVEFYPVDGADHGGPAFYCPAVYEKTLAFLNNYA